MKRPSPEALLGLVTRANALAAEGLSEECLIVLTVRSIAELADADFAAVYIQREKPASGQAWRLAGHCGADAELLAILPTSLGTGTGVLVPLFQNTREILESDLLDGASADAIVPPRVPSRGLFGTPIRRRNGRAVGALLLGTSNPEALDRNFLDTSRAVAHVLGIGIDNARLAAGQQRERRVAVQSQSTLGTVLESVSNGICVLERDGTVRVANKAFLSLFGLTTAIGLTQADVFASASVKPCSWDAFIKRLHELTAEPSQIDESEWELAAEPQRTVQRHSAPMRNHVGEIVGRVEVYTDITESHRLYTQLLNSERLRAIGEMASGVAHDFNNLLASILGQIELLHPELMNPSTGDAIRTIRQSALDGARIVRNLHGLARPRAENSSTSADLNETVREAVAMARPRLSSAVLRGDGAIDLRLDLAESGQLARVAVDPAEMREILLNLLFNAADAIPSGGQIEIVTRPGNAPNTADLLVRDTGHGMPESVRARIFEPFFSTKGPKGSGLGLAVAYSIISRRGGQIAVESTPGQGTTFTLVLPQVPLALVAAHACAPPSSAIDPVDDDGSVLHDVAEEPSRPTVRETRPVSLAASIRGARILVADDEPGLLAIVRQLMERSGAHVSIAGGGEAAVECIEREQFDVVITDLDMPEVDGWSVATAVRKHAPGTHIVMLTGWAAEIAPEDFKARGVDVVLAKPCSRIELEAAIGRLLTPKADTGLDVLLVDDEPAFARAVRDLLRLHGHRVTVVDSAAAALATTVEHAFDAILTDYSLGEITGAELAQKLADRGTRSFVVLVTGYATEIDDPTLLGPGIDAVLPKPCGGDDLRQVLSRVQPSAPGP